MHSLIMDSQASDTIFVDSLPVDALQGIAQEASQFDQLIDPALLASTSQTLDNPLDTALQIKSKRSILNWTPDMHRVLLEVLLEQCRVGKRADSGYKKEAWVATLSAVQAVYIGPIQIQEAQIKSRIDWCKALWKEWCSLEDNSGFGWDEPTQLFTAEESVWRVYIMVSNRYNSIFLIII
jgi:hypothetical protein